MTEETVLLHQGGGHQPHAEQGDKERIILSFLIILKHVRVDVQNSALVYILKLEARLNEIGIYILVIFIMSNFCSH